MQDMREELQWTRDELETQGLWNANIKGGVTCCTPWFARWWM
ncbi:MAG TPA: hypothetical protein VLA19_33395 [Herpetosiphonaceae bacterium]|nr:hypothetical protein [Herpetosiphonaceae bacterium]